MLFELELELELIQTHMVQKPMLRVEGEKVLVCLVCLFERSLFFKRVHLATLRPRMRFITFTLTFGLSLRRFISHFSFHSSLLCNNDFSLLCFYAVYTIYALCFMFYALCFDFWEFQGIPMK